MRRAFTWAASGSSGDSFRKRRYAAAAVALSPPASATCASWNCAVGLFGSSATTQENLANAAYFAGDTKAAIAAYQRYLKLAPDAADAPDIRQEIKRLKAQLATPVTTSGG